MEFIVNLRITVLTKPFPICVYYVFVSFSGRFIVLCSVLTVHNVLESCVLLCNTFICATILYFLVGKLQHFELSHQPRGSLQICSFYVILI